MNAAEGTAKFNSTFYAGIKF